MTPLPARLRRVIETLYEVGAHDLAAEVAAALRAQPVEAFVVIVDGVARLAPYWELFCLEVEALPDRPLVRAHRDWIYWVWHLTATTPTRVRVSSCRVEGTS
jgi:hypothetical protein